MSSTRDLAAADMQEINDSEGIPYTLINDEGEYPVRGIIGDIGSLLDPVSGEAIQGRSIEATVTTETLISHVAGKVPARGWRARVTGRDGKETTLFVKRNEYDRTIGLCRLTLGINLKDTDDGE